jgi:hypothetical protein
VTIDEVFTMSMTKHQYLLQSNHLAQEMRRIRAILDHHAEVKTVCAVASHEAAHIKKTHADLESVMDRIKALEREFWGTTLEN